MACRACTRSPMGRWCMRGTPLSSACAPNSARAAVSGRMAVPALPKKILRGASAVPSVGVVVPCSCHVVPWLCTRTPSCCSASRITWVSSDSSTPRKVVGCGHRPASSSARLVMLFDPGSRTVPLAWVTAGRSMKSGRWVNVMGNPSVGTQRPLAARIAGLAKQLVQAVGVLLRQTLGKGAQRLFKRLRLCQHLRAVG